MLWRGFALGLVLLLSAPIVLSDGGAAQVGAAVQGVLAAPAGQAHGPCTPHHVVQPHSSAVVIVDCEPPAMSTASPATIEGVLVCPIHDPTRWHPLVERDSAGAMQCT